MLIKVLMLNLLILRSEKPKSRLSANFNLKKFSAYYSFLKTYTSLIEISYIEDQATKFDC